MPLVTEVTNRYSPQRLMAWTNPQSSNATVIDAAKLALAAQDVEADFQIYAGITYDDSPTNAIANQHINVAVAGVVTKLRLRMDQAGDREEKTHEAYLKALKSLARVTARDRLLPAMKSRPYEREQIFGARRFDAYIPRSPRKRIDPDIFPLE